MITIVSLETLIILCPHRWNIIMIDQLYYYMLDGVIQSNVPFIRDSLKEVEYIRVGSLKNDSLMGNFVI